MKLAGLVGGLGLTLIGLSGLLVEGGPWDYPQTEHNRQTLVHLFEWKWTDIAHECESFLQHYGYGAVQISPPMEHIELVQNGNKPWWIRYQPVSYILQSRSGNRDQFIDMVKRCNAVGVRIVADVVVNHMVGAGQASGQNGVGSSAGSPFKGYGNGEYFPKVPYDNSDLFHDRYCKSGGCDSNCNIQGSCYSSNAYCVRMCRLSGLLDLDQSNQAVRNSIVGFFDDMIDIGIAGFRMDAAKHMWPSDICAFMGQTKNLRSDIFGDNAKPFFVGEVIDMSGTEAVKGSEYTNCGRITNFKYGHDITGAVQRSNNFKFFTTFGPKWDFNWATNDVLTFIDNHDTQRSNEGYLTYKNGDQYAMAVTVMLAWDYGYPRVMSSYYFNSHDQGPPADGNYNVHKYSLKAHRLTLTGPVHPAADGCVNIDGRQFVVWPHSDRTARMQVWKQSRHRTIESPSNDPGKAFSWSIIKGEVGLLACKQASRPDNIVMSFREKWKEMAVLSSSEASGEVQGFSSSSCTNNQQPINVDGSGYAQINVGGSKTFAIHGGQKIGNVVPTQSPVNPTQNPVNPTGPPVTQGPPPVGSQKTVIFVHFDSVNGQNLFIRGGLSAEAEGSCNKNNLAGDKCSIPIQHVTNVPSSFRTYQDWKKGDDYLDWYGAEPNQGTYHGEKAAGTPLAWSTNQAGHLGYQPLNTFGSGYWIVVLDMDCTKTNNGWFELKAYVDAGVGWESDINQGRCSGNAGTGNHPNGGKNHFGMCGKLNVYERSSSKCIINNIPNGLQDAL